jgi:hypothetical protein
VQYPAAVDVVVEHLARGKPGGACAGFAVQLDMAAPPGQASTRRRHASKPRLPRGCCSSRPGPLRRPPCYTRPPRPRRPRALPQTPRPRSPPCASPPPALRAPAPFAPGSARARQPTTRHGPAAEARIGDSAVASASAPVLLPPATRLLALAAEAEHRHDFPAAASCLKSVLRPPHATALLPLAEAQARLQGALRLHGLARAVASWWCSTAASCSRASACSGANCSRRQARPLPGRRRQGIVLWAPVDWLSPVRPPFASVTHDDYHRFHYPSAIVPCRSGSTPDLINQIK